MMLSRKISPLPRMGLTILSLLVVGCSLVFPDRTAPKSAIYHITKPEKPWVAVPTGESTDTTDALKADMAFENPKTGAILSINSICRKYTKTTLDDLTNNLVRGIEEKKLIEEKQRILDATDAKETLFEGVVDKVKIYLRTVVMLKNGCDYDFMYVTTPQNDAESRVDFEKFITSFKTE